MLQIASVLKSNGTEGELVFGFKNLAPEDIDTQEPVFIQHDGLPVPYFIEKMCPRGTGKALVKLTGIDSLDDAEELCGRAVMGRRSDYSDLEDEDSLEGLIGWTVKDENGSTAGTVCDIEDIPGNPCIVVDTEKGQHLIPLHEDLILSVDSKKQVIQITIPEGLITD